MADGRIKINELPETALVKDNGIFIIENDTTTQKISLGSLINYIKEHEEIAEHFLKQSAVDSENGVAPLDSSGKIPSANLPFGSTENTVCDGALGQALSDNLSSHLSNTGNPHTVTKSQVGLSDVDNTADIAKPVSTLQQNAIDIAYASSNAYTDAKIAELIDGAPSTLDTLGEIAQALQEGGGISDALDAAIGSKANRAELDSHTGNDTIHITASERTKWNSKMGNTEDAGNTTVTFTESSDLSNINSGEKTGTIMGKISKAISTLISHVAAKATAGTFGHVKLSDTYKNAVTGGNAANGIGASQKALADAYSALNSNLGNCTFSVKSDGAYVTYTPEGGADTVTKKLGSDDLKSTEYQKESSHYGTAYFDVSGIDSIMVQRTDSLASLLYVCGGDDTKFDSNNNEIKGTVLGTLAAGGTKVIDCSGYDYVAIEF
ncbi:MAG: hypothetical protein HDR11_07370, partial [Lachnospiraceae bacterium]|nr:hypothetical protein [Lachnospiraceae bacterium]